jgi:Zn finger protein HypA/HybF involved in hydrogenase expression
MGTGIGLRCGACDFEATAAVGVGMAGVRNTAIGCTRCRAVHVVPVESWHSPSADVELWDADDGCPSCGRAVEVIDADGDARGRWTCPQCRERSLVVDPGLRFLWD